MRRLSWPRKTGRAGHLGAGGKALAVFIRVVELVLDGLRSNTVSTKRELYYRDPKLFERQAIVDQIIEDLAAGLGIRREELNVAAASKGLFSGALKITTTDQITLEGSDQVSTPLPHVPSPLAHAPVAGVDFRGHSLQRPRGSRASTARRRDGYS